MLLAYTYLFGAGSNTPELCLIPDKVDQFFRPIPVQHLHLTEHAVLAVGLNEAVRVMLDNNSGLIVEAILPSLLHLTPNLPAKPGIQVARAKIMLYDNGQVRVFFMLEKSTSWREWTPNTEKL